MTDPNNLRSLLECPFCGGEAIWFDDDGYGNCGVICHCEPEPCILFPQGREDEARAIWNTRPALDSLAAENARLAGALEPFAKVADDLERVGAQHSVHPSQIVRRHNYDDCAAARAALAPPARQDGETT